MKNLQAVVKWGDASATARPDYGSLSVDSTGTLIVTGSHTYAKEGNYAVTVTAETKPPIVTPPNALIAPLILATIDSAADVSSEKEGGVHLTETATQSFTGIVGRFDFKNVDLSFSATIAWGDGSTSQGTVKRGGPDFDDWVVVGTHTYSMTGHYKVHIGVLGVPSACRDQ